MAAMADAQRVDVSLERYRDAVGARELGSVHGRVFHERRRPSAPDMPLTGTAVALLPHSEAWLLRLNAIKRGARDSLESYREAATGVRESRDAYEKTLLEAGAGDLSQGATVDADGRFTLDGIPAGPWILIAFRSTYVSKTPQERPGAERPPASPTPFLAPDRLHGYHVVTYWLRELTVVAGAVEAIDLTDRNVWFTGVTENRQAPRLPDQPYQRR